MEEIKHSKKMMLAFAQTCMYDLLSDDTKDGEMPEISSWDLTRVDKVLNKYR
jgi:hypothetical protein